MRLFIPFAFLLSTSAASAQLVATQSAAPLPDAPSFSLVASAESAPAINGAAPYSSSLPQPAEFSLFPEGYKPQQTQDPARSAQQSDRPANPDNLPLDERGNPIPLNRQQPKRIFGFFPNFRSVSAGAAVHPPGFRYNFKIATRQAFDYSSFIFLGVTSLSAEGLNTHPKLGKGIGGAYAYTWRGFLDKTDGTYLSAWLLPSILHQDNRYFPLGDGHSILARELYVMSRQVVTRTYGGRQTFNISGLGGKILAQYISRFYYPPGSSDFGVLASKFALGAARDIGFTSLREFYPDAAAHYVKKHRAKVAQEQSSRDVQAAQASEAPALP